jgi:hypothetical protein
MSVLAEGFSIIVRRSTIDSDFPGGISEYRRLAPNKTFCADQYLTRVGFPDWPETKRFLEGRLHSVGLTQHYVNGNVDVGLVHQDEGIAALTPWLEWGRDEAGRSIAWLSGTDAGELGVPEGWSHDSAPRYIADAEATERLIPRESAPSHSGLPVMRLIAKVAEILCYVFAGSILLSVIGHAAREDTESLHWFALPLMFALVIAGLELDQWSRHK